MIRGGVVALPTADLERAVRFYVETLGMKLVEHAPDAGWAALDAGDGFRIGLDARAKVAASSAAVGLFSKEPLERALAIFENRGVAFERRGDRAYFADPDGNVLYLR